MRRREFISLIGSVAAWPLAARAQQPERMRRIGILMLFAEEDPAGKIRIAAFIEGLQQLGWTVGRNIEIDIRWGATDAVLSRRQAAELVTLAPDVVRPRCKTYVRLIERAPLPAGLKGEVRTFECKKCGKQLKIIVQGKAATDRRLG